MPTADRAEAGIRAPEMNGSRAVNVIPLTPCRRTGARLAMLAVPAGVALAAAIIVAGPAGALDGAGYTGPIFAYAACAWTTRAPAPRTSTRSRCTRATAQMPSRHPGTVRPAAPHRRASSSKIGSCVQDGTGSSPAVVGLVRPRLPPHGEALSVHGGPVGPCEEPLGAVRRGLAEEVGVTAVAWRPMGTVAPCPAQLSSAQLLHTVPGGN